MINGCNNLQSQQCEGRYLDTVEVADSSSAKPTTFSTTCEISETPREPENGSSGLSFGTTKDHAVGFVSLPDGTVAIVDAEDINRVSRHKWKHHENGKGGSYCRRSSLHGNVWLHRFIINAQPGTEVDHINGDGLDCRKSNLRITDRRGNAQNRKPRKDGSGLKGVSRRHDASFRAAIRVDGRKIHLGYFHTAPEAALAYDRAALQHYGEFARLNFPEVA
jgi:hypothetical protein